MSRTVLASFDNTAEAEKVVDALNRRGISSRDIGVIAKEGVVTEPIGATEENPAGARVTEGALSGATAGGVIGGLAGLILGLSAITIPGLGALLIGGPIAAALGLTGAAATTVSGATTGAVAGGLIGALSGLGVPRDVAQRYEDRVREGGVILAIPAATEADAEEIRDMLENSGASDVTLTGERAAAI